MGTSFFQLIISFILVFGTFSIQKSDSFDAISNLLKDSDSRGIASYFSPIVEMNVLNEEDDYSKAQAELILRAFLSKNKPSSVKIVHRLNSNPNYQFAVLSVQSTDKKFRISISMAKNNTSFQITAFRIEYDKD